MHINKILSIFEFTVSLLKKFNEMQKYQEKNMYRIIEIKDLPNNQYKLIIQIIGKSSIIECSPDEIAGVDTIIEGFSKADVRTITYLTCTQNNKPRFKIIAQEFCEYSNGMLFRLKDLITNTIIIKTANQIIMDKNIINYLNNEDINSISYIAGYECSQI